jgi:hypothetical protein
MEGLWYDPIEETPSSGLSANSKSHRYTAGKPYWSKVVYYQNRDNSSVDLLWLADIKQNKFLAVRGYDYKDVQKNGVLLPTKIEIFRTDARAVSRERLVKIDLK